MLDHSHGLLGHLNLSGTFVDYNKHNVLFFGNICQDVRCDKGVLLREL